MKQLLLLLWFLSISGALHAQTYVSSCHSNNGGNSPASCTLSVTSGNCVFVAAATNGTNLPVTISGNSDTYTSVIGPLDNTGSGHLNFQAFKTTVSTTNASDSVTATWTNNGSFQYMLAVQYSGLDSSCTVDQTSSDIYNASPCGPCTMPNNATGVTKTNELVIGFFSWGNIGTTTFTAGTGYTARETSGNGQIGIGVEDKNITVAASQNGDASTSRTSALGVDFLITVQTPTSSTGASPNAIPIVM